MLEKAATLKWFEYSLLGKAFEIQTNVIKKQTEVISKKEMKNEKYCDKVENALLYLSKEQVEKYVEIDKRMKLKDFMYGKPNFNRYGMVISFVSNFLTEVT